jgi:hypothetical protein
MLGRVRSSASRKKDFGNTYDYAHCGACAAPTGRGIRRIFQILGFSYAPLCVAHPFMAEACSL